MSCKDCVFRGIFQDMGASCDVCNLHCNLADAVLACELSADCRHRFTVGDAKKIVIEREGGLPEIPPKKAEPRVESDFHKTINEAFAELAEKACKAVNLIMKNFQELQTEEEDTK